MAEGGVRKSNRIKSRARMIYTEDDFDYDLHFDVSSDVSDTLESRSQKKNNDKFGKRRKKSYPHVSKKVNKKPDLQDIKTSSENNKPAFGKFLEHSDEDISANSLVSSHVTCLICNKVCLSEKVLEDHMVQHKSDEGKLKGFLVCGTCDKLCVDQSSYDRHIKSHSSGRKYKCEICDKAFADSCSLKRHVKSHYDERPYTCDLCFKSFRDNPSLIRHQKTHTDRPRMFQCIKCDKNFADKHSLKRHERTHTGLRPFECKICFKTFSEPGSFKRHLKIHTGVRNFLCPICNRSFLEKQSLMRHQKNVCGFGDAVMASGASFMSSFSGDQSHGSHDSGADNSEFSRASVSKEISSVVNENSLTGDSLNTSASSGVQTKSFTSQAVDSADKSETSSDLKDAPSLHSLIQKDPNLYDSITEIVKSIDSYEKMLNLCGDTGQVEIDAALTREPAPMPDSLLCFECGELLVNGENFRVDGKSFHPSLCNSYKCLTCEDDDVYGKPPVLKAEVYDGDISLSNGEKYESGTSDGQMQEGKPEFVKDDVNKHYFGTDESLEHLRERLRTQHGVFFFGGMYDNDDEDESDTNEQADISSNATTSRSYSTDSEFVQTFVNQPSTQSNLGLGENSSIGACNLEDTQHDVASKKSGTSMSTISERVHGNLANVTPKMDYETDDQTIPSVFPCHLCTKVFATSAFLTRHLVLHKNSPHKCMVCGKTFTNSLNLKRHMTIHTGEKPYTCPYCSKRFRDPSNFSKHKKQCCASLSVSSPADSIISTSSVSSPQSLDDSSPVGNAGKYVADLKQTLSFPFHSPTSKASVSQDIPLRFSYDNDSEEDLPVTFGQHPTDSDSPSLVIQYPEADGRFMKNSLKSETKNHLAHNDWNGVREDTDKADVLTACEICGKTFKNEQFLEMHMKYHSGDPKVTCIECGKCFADSFGLKRHLRIHAGIRPHVCEYCGRGYCDNWSLKKHKSRGCMLMEVKVPADFLHPCPQCTRVFSDLEYLEEHMNTHKGMLKFECDICQKKFSEAFNLKRHRRLHMAICPGCDREFKDVKALNEHQSNECPVNNTLPDTTDKEDGFTCPECGRNYTTKAYLERHKKFHSDLKPYVCEICNKRFSEAFRLRRHFKVHNGARSFNCETCGKGFTDTVNLKRHMANSSCSFTKQQPQQGVVDFHCFLCDKIFSKSYLLARHMNVHSQERPFACDVCERTYKDTSSLRRHQLIHQGIKSFICPICNKDFFYSDSLKRHMAGTCGKKSKSRRRGRGRHKGQRKRKYNNNINMKNNNTIEQDTFIPDPKHQEVIINNIASIPHSSSPANIAIYQARIPARDVKIGQWSCHRKKQCWRCDLKFKTTSSLLKHSRIHCHKKPWFCSHCFSRWSRKLYWKVHLRTHKSEPKRKKTLKPASVQKEELKRTQRSNPRARLS